MAAIDARCGLLLAVAMLGVNSERCSQAPPRELSGVSLVGCRDLNPGPLDPQAGSIGSDDA
jgi:hypothetical protein